MEEFTEEKKLRVAHLYSNMNDLLKEIRILDKTSLIFSGVIWSWILTVKIDNEATILGLSLVPLSVVSLLAYKAYSLLNEYRVQKNLYKKHLKNALLEEELASDSKRKRINSVFYAVVIFTNLLATLAFFYLNSGYEFVKIATH